MVHFWHPKARLGGGTIFGGGGPLLAAKSGPGGPFLANRSGPGSSLLATKSGPGGHFLVGSILA